MKSFNLIQTVFTFLIWLFIGCSGDKTHYLNFNMGSNNQMEIDSLSQNTYKLLTRGNDPYVSMHALNEQLGKDQYVLTFEYKAAGNVNFLEVFFISKETGSFGSNVLGSQKHSKLVETDNWTTYSMDLSEYIVNLKWNSENDFLRLDFGDQPDIELSIRNVYFRERNESENKAFHEKEAFKIADIKADNEINSYLSNSYKSNVTNVEVQDSLIIIQGNYSSVEDEVMLCAIKPWDNIVTLRQFEGIKLRQSPFSIEVKRYIEVDGLMYDQALSKWAIVKKDQLISSGRHADQIKPVNAMSPGKLLGRKGLGGYHINRGFSSDLTDLNISSITVNISFTRFMYLNKRENAISHTYGGKTYYFDSTPVDGLDRTMMEAAKHDIVVAAIILVNPANQCVDSKIGELLQDKNYGGENAFFTMPNMTSAESVNCYAAALDFLASRYSRKDSKYGRIHHWIMHNEVDAGNVWTNMGKNRPLHVFLDAYHKSMRLCYNIARQYDQYSEVFASFTHSWAQPVPVDGDYATLDMIEGLLNYSRVEGDFQWGLACHPYPEDLNEPKTWNDESALFSMITPMVTFKNLEVLDKWIKLPENKYLGTKKRTLWLSENGTNSRTYSDQDLAEQAAGFAYAWKKLKHLSGINAFQWHNWMDGRGEFGLRIGLRKYPDDEIDPAGKKPVWFTYQAADTPREDKIFDQYKSVVGIQDWSEILQTIN